MGDMRLVVEICRAEGLKRTVTLQPPHPYARIHLINNPDVSFYTSTQSRTTKPNWNEKFKFDIKANESLEINIWDRKDNNIFGRILSLGDKFLGCARLTPKLIEKYLDAGELVLNLEQIPKPHVSKITSFVVVKLTVEQEQKQQQQQQQPQKQQQPQPQEQPQQQQSQPKQNQLLAVPKIADENNSTASEESGKVVIKKSASKVFTVVKVDEEHPLESTSVPTSTPTAANNTEDDTSYTRSISNVTAVMNRPLRHDQSYNTIITQDSKTLHGSVSDGASMITAINVAAAPSVSVIVDTPPPSPQPQSQADAQEPSSQPSQLQPTPPAIMSESMISSSTPPSSSNLTPPVIQVQDEDQKIIVSGSKSLNASLNPIIHVEQWMDSHTTNSIGVNTAQPNNSPLLSSSKSSPVIAAQIKKPAIFINDVTSNNSDKEEPKKAENETTAAPTTSQNAQTSSAGPKRLTVPSLSFSLSNEEDNVDNNNYTSEYQRRTSEISQSSMSSQTSSTNMSMHNNEEFDKKRTSVSSLKVPIFGRRRSSGEKKVKKKLSFQGSGASITSSDFLEDTSVGGSSLGSNSSLVKSTESIYEGFKKEELNVLAEKCKKFNYDLLNYGEKVTIFKLNMPREEVVEDSYCFLTNLKPTYSRTQFLIKFSNEEGVDYGGVGKEWFHILSSEVFRTDYGLFVINKQTNQLDINVAAPSIVPEHKMYYKFIGQMLGLALYNNYHVDVSLNNLIFKHILSEPVDLEDLKFYDIAMYNSLKWISENDINNADLMYMFSAFYTFMDETITVDLIENGRDVEVTESNKMEFVKAYVEWRLNKSIRVQTDSIIEGFFQIIPKELISIFNSNDLQLIICGLDTIEVSKWKANTVYRNCTQYSKQVIWFWRAIEHFDNDRRRKLLQLVTGSSRLPIKEFGENGVENSTPFTIALFSPYKDTNSLPIINTCFNRISLPCYESYDKLMVKLKMTVDETREFSVQ